MLETDSTPVTTIAQHYARSLPAANDRDMLVKDMHTLVQALPLRIEPPPMSSLGQSAEGSDSDDALFGFSDETGGPVVTNGGPAWKVLAIDDDADFQRSIAFALRGMRFKNRRIELLQAKSMAEAARVLARHRDIAVILLDVVMETDDAGLRLCKALRETIGNATVRIVLVTGEPGLAPMKNVMLEYDINDYWAKPDLSVERLHTVLYANLRAYEHLHDTQRARRGLQMIVEATNAMVVTHSLPDFAARLIREITSLLGMPAEGLMCAAAEQPGGDSGPRVISACGRFSSASGHDLSDLGESEVALAVQQSLRERRSLSLPHARCQFFPAEIAGGNYVAYIALTRPLDHTEEDLLRVFTVNICTGLRNVALVSRLDEIAYQDQQLGLANRNRLVNMLDAYLEAPGSVPYALMLLDIDDFSGANLALGFDHGNLLLEEVVRRLRATFSKQVLLARLHDDRFALFGPASEVDDAHVIRVRSMATDADAPQFISICSARMELAAFDRGADEAIAVANLLLKEAKHRGYSQHVEYLPGVEHAPAERHRLATTLRTAIADEEIRIALQPQIDMADGRVIGAEVLARWNTRDGRVVMPDVFVPIAEATGYILPMGELVFRRACRAAVQLQRSGFADLRIAVNVSPLQFAQENLPERLMQIVEREGATPAQFEIEITESLAMHGFDYIHDRLQALRARGFSVAIDDFGTGFSSLSYLRRLPVDRLKIDKAFVNEIGTVADESAIADMVIRLAASMGMQVIAEGIETEAQATWLRARGCTIGQGWLYAKAMPLEAFRNWLLDRQDGR